MKKIIEVSDLLIMKDKDVGIVFEKERGEIPQYGEKHMIYWFINRTSSILYSDVIEQMELEVVKPGEILTSLQKK